MHLGRGRERELSPEAKEIQPRFSSLELDQPAISDALKSRGTSQNTRPGICLKMPHTPARPRRAAEHSAALQRIPHRASAKYLAWSRAARRHPQQSCSRDAMKDRWPQNPARPSLKSTASIDSIPLTNRNSEQRTFCTHRRLHQLLRKASILSPSNTQMNHKTPIYLANLGHISILTSPNGPRPGSLIA